MAGVCGAAAQGTGSASSESRPVNTVTQSYGDQEMKKKLVIVEGEAQCRTVAAILGPDYKVLASMGHVCDLPEDRVGVDVKAGFRPEYVILPGKAAIVKRLLSAMNAADEIYLATDPDLEG